MNFYYLIVLVILGLVFGSFINAWVWRTSKNMPVSKGRSMCPHCKHQLAWYDLVPVLSYISLKGRCRYCRKPISLQYPLVELGTTLLFVGLYYYTGPSGWLGWLQLAISLMVAVLLVAAFVYDAKYMQLPEIYMLPAIALGLVSLGLKAWNMGWEPLIPQVIGLGVVIIAYTALWYFSKGKWLGAGDIRLVAVMGLFLQPKQLLVGLFVAYLAGAAYGVYVIAKSKNKTKRGIKVPFGPFLIIGFYVGLFFGSQIANWYLGLL
jgi:prepilin signal peptidase PulO-like enzyme (type II secretory pathway)